MIDPINNINNLAHLNKVLQHASIKKGTKLSKKIEIGGKEYSIDQIVQKYLSLSASSKDTDSIYRKAIAKKIHQLDQSPLLLKTSKRAQLFFRQFGTGRHSEENLYKLSERAFASHYTGREPIPKHLRFQETAKAKNTLEEETTVKIKGDQSKSPPHLTTTLREPSSSELAFFKESNVPLPDKIMTVKKGTREIQVALKQDPKTKMYFLFKLLHDKKIHRREDAKAHWLDKLPPQEAEKLAQNAMKTPDRFDLSEVISRRRNEDIDMSGWEEVNL